MDLESPISSVVPSSHGRVLAVLARTTANLTGRRVAELVGPAISRRTVANALSFLADTGVVLVESHPPANLYRLNRDHVAATAIEALASLRTELIKRMGNAAASWDIPAEAVWLFGSFARGDGSVNSDIDVLVVHPDGMDPDDRAWSNQLADFATQVHSWSGNYCSIIEYSSSEIGELGASGNQLYTELARDGIRLRSARSQPTVAEVDRRRA